MSSSLVGPGWLWLRLPSFDSRRQSCERFTGPLLKTTSGSMKCSCINCWGPMMALNMPFSACRLQVDSIWFNDFPKKWYTLWACVFPFPYPAKVQPSCTSISRTTNSSFAAKIVFLNDPEAVWKLSTFLVSQKQPVAESPFVQQHHHVLKTNKLDKSYLDRETNNLRLKPEGWCRRGVSLPEHEMWTTQESQNELSLRSAQQIWLDKERMSSSGQSSTKDRNYP